MAGIIEDMEEKIIQHLREVYKPLAIILHGSRASGHEREHSDWDFVLLYPKENELPSNGRLDVDRQNVEFSHHHIPAEDIEKEFGVKLQNSRVVFEMNSEGSGLLTQAQQIYSQPVGWSDKDKYNHSLWMRGRIDGMHDAVNNPIVFERYASDFFARITNYWFLSLHDKNPQPIYLALQEIAEKDPEYFIYIEKFVHGSNVEKVKAAEDVYQKCFGGK